MLNFIFALIEKSWLPPLCAISIGSIATVIFRGGFLFWILASTILPLAIVAGLLLLLLYTSWIHDGGIANWEPYVSFKDQSIAKKYKGKKIPIEEVVEAYIAEQAEIKEDLLEVFLKRNSLFRFCFTIGHIKFYLFTFLKQNFGHSPTADHDDIHGVYNRGNDFYGWFLGETMIYTSGIFQSLEEKLETGQKRKLDLVCQYTQMKKDEEHLDIGCGWGTLVIHAAKTYGTKSTGVTLAEEQSAFGMERATKAGVKDRVTFLTMDYRKIPTKKYNKITCLEMAEHVGIKNFSKFLHQVKGMLTDDGIFYLQIAGLRRAWQFEDLVWGLFMGKYVFPGADASCPLGFVVNHLEEAGFEVHRVENCGVHYSITIRHWYNNWKSNKAAILKKYGENWYRKWLVFLGWSTIIAAQGSSTVFLITATKNLKNDVSSISPEEAKQQRLTLNRTANWVGQKPIATQQ
jgi:cyclopropane fatty-acyl-phospholipid synthase-like methyltransferase